jgi:hypothetical protein
MAFIRKRVTGPTPTSFTYTLLEAYRVAGMPRQRILANLGRSPTLEERIVMLCREAAELRRGRGIADLEKGQQRLDWLAAEIAKLEHVRDELADRADTRRKRAA